MRSVFSVVVLMSFTVFLSGCLGAPGPMPRGYTSFDKAYKSAPGPKSSDIGYNYTLDQNAEVIEAVRVVAHDLVDQLDRRLSFAVDQVNLQMPAQTAFFNTFDHALRQALVERGYLLSSVDAIPVSFATARPHPSCVVSDGVSKDQGRVYLALVIQQMNKKTSETMQEVVGDYFTVPLYGFQEAGLSTFETPSCGGLVMSTLAAQLPFDEYSHVGHDHGHDHGHMHH